MMNFQSVSEPWGLCEESGCFSLVSVDIFQSVAPRGGGSEKSVLQVVT